MKFTKLTRPQMRKLPAGKSISEHGVTFERIINGDGKFSVNIMVDGVRIHRVIGKESEGVTREKVEQFIAQARTEALHERLNLPSGRKVVLILKSAVVQYIERLAEEGGKDIIKKARRLEQHVVPLLGNKPLSQISKMDIEKFKQKRKEDGAQNSTVNRELAAFSHLLNKAVEWKWIANRSCIIRRLKEETPRITYLTSNQANRLIEVAKEDYNPHIYLFILIGLETGMRRMEILSIRIKDIDLERRIISIPQAKAGRREQPITKHLAKVLDYYIQPLLAKQEWLFISPTSKVGDTMNIEKPFRRVVKAAGLDPKVVVRHTLRHTAITHLVQAGVDLPTVKRISGHKTLSMVERYSHQNGNHITQAMDKLEERYRSSDVSEFKKIGKE